MTCKTCMWFAPKGNLGRCRRHAPTMNGYPVVFLDDWCGDHKLQEGPTPLIEPKIIPFPTPLKPTEALAYSGITGGGTETGGFFEGAIEQAPQPIEDDVPETWCDTRDKRGLWCLKDRHHDGDHSYP